MASDRRPRSIGGRSRHDRGRESEKGGDPFGGERGQSSGTDAFGDRAQGAARGDGDTGGGRSSRGHESSGSRRVGRHVRHFRVEGNIERLVARVRSARHDERERSGFQISGRSVRVHPLRALPDRRVVGFTGHARVPGGDGGKNERGGGEDERDIGILDPARAEESRCARVEQHGSGRSREDIHELPRGEGGYEDVGEDGGQDQGYFEHRNVEEIRDAFQLRGRPRMPAFEPRHGRVLGVQRETRVGLVLSPVWNGQDGAGQPLHHRGRLEAEGARRSWFAGDRWIDHPANPRRQRYRDDYDDRGEGGGYR